MIPEQQLIPYQKHELPEGPYLIFAPHPDDETLGMGGTIALAAEKGVEVHVVFITNGDMGGDPDIRKLETEEAARVLGIGKRFYVNLKDRHVSDERLPGILLDRIFTEVNPKVLFLPSFQEIHPDHRATTRKILYYWEAIKAKPPLWFYEINRHGEVNALIDITPVMDIKKKAMAVYKSQLAQLDYQLHSTSLDVTRSVSLGEPSLYCEGFWIHDTVSGQDPETEYLTHLSKYFDGGALGDVWAKPDEKATRKLKERLKHQNDTLSRYHELVDALSAHINHATMEIHGHQAAQEKMTVEIEALQRTVDAQKATLSSMGQARSHRLASAYIQLGLRCRDRLHRVGFFLKGVLHQGIYAVFSHFKVGREQPASSFATSVEKKTCHDHPTDIESDMGGSTKGGGNSVVPKGKVASNSPLSNYSFTLRSALIDPDLTPVMETLNVNRPQSISDEMSVYQEHLVHGATRVVDVRSDVPMAFPIFVSEDNLAGIRLFMATYRRINPGVLVMEIYWEEDLKSDDPVPFRRCGRLAPSIPDNAFLTFSFDPIHFDSNHAGPNKLIVSLQLNGGDSALPIAVWAHEGRGNDPEDAYQVWIASNERCNAVGVGTGGEDAPSEGGDEVLKDGHLKQKIDVIYPLFDPFETSLPLEWIETSLNAICQQIDMLDHLILLDSREKKWQTLVERNGGGFWSAQERSGKIKVLSFDENASLDEKINQAIDATSTPFFIYLRPTDVLASHAIRNFMEILKTNREAVVVYGDEDWLDGTGMRVNPFFKPGWSPDLLTAFPNYLSGGVLCRKSTIQTIGGVSPGVDLCPMYDLMLKVGEWISNGACCTGSDASESELKSNVLSALIVRMPKVICHRRKGKGASHRKAVLKNAQRALEFAIERAREKGKGAVTLEEGRTADSFRVRYPVNSSETRVSIIIPFKDAPEVLETAVNSILKKTTYSNYEILCVDNQSCRPETMALITSFASHPKVTVIRDDRPFNYSALNNRAVLHTKGPLLLFLNSDVEVINEGWLQAMVEHACRKEVGAVGARLLYANDTIQHAGIVVGIAGLAGHAFKHIPGERNDVYHGLPQIVRNVSAVTGACMMMRRSLFDRVGGFDEDGLQVSYNDLDICLKLQKLGYRIVYTPFAELYHYESYSRGYAYDPSATHFLRDRWKERLEADPYYHPSLAITKEDWSLG